MSTTKESVWRAQTGVYTDAQSRLQVLERFDAEGCRKALEEGGLQATVRKALERRLCKLEREAAR